MNWAQLLIQLGSQLGSALIERFAKGVVEPKQEVPGLDVTAIATDMASGAARNRSSDATERTMDERIKELREKIVSIAKSQEGKSDPDEYWRTVRPDGDNNVCPKSWCGIGYMWCLHVAHDGLRELEWKRGFGITSAFQAARLPFPMTRDPKPGDMAYFTKNQHHAVVEDVAGGLIRLVNFNGAGGKVTRNQVAYSAPAAYYSIEKALAAVAGKSEVDDVGA